MSHLFFPSDYPDAIREYAPRIDQRLGVLVAWDNLLNQGFDPAEIIAVLSPGLVADDTLGKKQLSGEE
ncbi:MAG: hypothetical protein V4724_37715 [Pseudomonadota bacterium]